SLPFPYTTLFRSVRFLARFPGAFRLLFVAREPVGAPQLVIRLDEIGPELERLLEKGLSVFVHLALQVDEPEVEVRVQGRLLVVVESDRLGKVLDRLSEDTLLHADVADVDTRQRLGG